MPQPPVIYAVLRGRSAVAGSPRRNSRSQSFSVAAICAGALVASNIPLGRLNRWNELVTVKVTLFQNKLRSKSPRWGKRKSQFNVTLGVDVGPILEGWRDASTLGAKEDGETRFCVNEFIQVGSQRLAFTTPIDDYIAAREELHFFFKLDPPFGYQPRPLAEGATPYTSFIRYRGVPRLHGNAVWILHCAGAVCRSLGVYCEGGAEVCV